MKHFKLIVSILLLLLAGCWGFIVWVDLHPAKPTKWMTCSVGYPLGPPKVIKEKPIWIEDSPVVTGGSAGKWNGKTSGHWVCSGESTISGDPAPPGTGVAEPICIEIQPQDTTAEDPKAARASIYPHPKPPEHLQDYNININVKRGWWKAEGILRIEQPRPKSGWWFSIACPLEDGKFVSAVKLSPELKEVALILLDADTSQQIGHATLPLDKLKGTVVLK